jgi:hypothetical protein
MFRRDLLKMMAASATLPLLGINAQANASNNSDGPIFINIHADGGWDAASFVDPKTDPTINKWAADSQPITPNGSNIKSGPWPSAQRIVENHFQRMLVINGVDCETNSHVVGKRHSSCGRLEDGFPAMGAIFAEINGPHMPMAFIAGGGGYAETADLRPFSRIPYTNTLKKMFAETYGQAHSKTTRVQQTDRLGDDLKADNQLPKFRQQLKFYRNAFAGDDVTDAFAAEVNELNHFDQNEADYLAVPGIKGAYPTTGKNYVPNQLKSIHSGLLACKTGVCTAFTLYCGHFDTHSDDENDSSQQANFEQLAGILDYLWAKAEDMGIADRIVLYVNSDFARTPSYNSDNGKDHWPVTSAVIMANNKSWTNRVIGATDDKQNALKIDPSNNQVATENAMIIKPHHVLDNIRTMLGIDPNNGIAQRYPLLTDNDKINGVSFDFTQGSATGYL